ncbi:MAG: hypothetical protein ACRDTT_16195, partial [Pseudonocardiaceae bacterium]
DNTQLVHTVPFDSVAWHLRGGNPRAVGLCLTTPKPGYSRSEWLGPQVNKVACAAWWVARACALFGLPIRHLNHPQIRAAAGGSKRDGGALMHVDYTWATRDGNHTDPRNFPMDVCIQWAQAISGPSPEGGIEDMALDTKFRGWNGGDVTIEQWMNALSQALANVPVGVWEHSIDNPYGNKVAVKHVVSALEARLIRVEASVADMATRLPAPPAPPKPSDKRG